jgi:tRNA(Ile)-lysidine synthase
MLTNGPSSALTSAPPAQIDLFAVPHADTLWHKKHWLIALSGGPDSFALWHAALTQTAGHEITITAVTIDHGLRADSALEAEALAAFARQNGWRHHILKWQGPKPTSRLQERARAARYQLICAYADDIGADALLSAHHADDQMETILFRLSRGSGPAGLAGMAALSMKGRLEHYRPLIHHRKAELITYCATHELPCFFDPSNKDPRFARSKARELLPLFESHGMNAEQWLRLGRRAARAEKALAALAAVVIAHLPALAGPHSYSLPYAALIGLPEEILLRLIIQEIQRIGGEEVAPRLEQSEALLDNLTRALAHHQSYRQTLAHCLISLGPKGLRISRAKPRRTCGHQPI